MEEIAGGRVDAAITEQRARTVHRKKLREASEAKFSHITSAETPGAHVATDNPIPKPPFWGRRIVTDISPRHIFPFINKTALFTGQWGFKQKGMTPDAYRRLLDEKAEPVFDSLKTRAIEERLVEPKVVYGYFPVQSDQNDLIVYDPTAFEAGKHVERLRFSFPRQTGRRKLCISDFFRSRASNQFDVLGIQLVTVGDRATEAAEKLRAADKYQDYLFLHGLGVETAEALAEFWHKRMRQELGFGSEDATSIEQLFHQGYRGSRFSLGYPACPNLEDRTKIVDLLNPAEIGVILSENFMLVPEQSTDALIAHHPQAKYFEA
jgi:5-methyltetrahydrofolate--homocysteine methyltransferase